MKRGVLIVVAGLLSLNIAQAQDLVQVGAWTIMPSSSSCSAFNRDVQEFNSSRYNAMVLRQEADTNGVGVTVHFWPGALTPEAEIVLKLTTSDRKAISVVANARDTYAAHVAEALSPKQLEEMTNGEFVTAAVPRVDGVVMVNMKDFGAALVALADCAMAL